MRASIISTGEELVHGRIVDTNAAFIAAGLEGFGFEVRRIVVLGDQGADLTFELLRCAEDSSVIVLSGGLGPTADDRTRWAVAEAASRELTEDGDTLRFLRERLRGFGREVDERQITQARFPEGSVVFPNPNGTARGFACLIGDAWLVAMPGVPVEMRAMFAEEVVPFLLERVGPGGHVRCETLNIYPIAEPDADARIRDMTEADRNPVLGITVRDGVITVSVTARADTPEEADALVRRDLDELKARFGNLVFGSGESTLAVALSHELSRCAYTIGVAESLTGGLIGYMLVEVPGISSCFLGGVVAYANEAKIHQLGVPRGMIETHGAVSSQVAEAMAEGVCRALECDVGISTTGIAGPTGGTGEKPVGLTYVGVCVQGEVKVEEYQLRGGRARVRDRAAKHALNMARLALLGREA